MNCQQFFTVILILGFLAIYVVWVKIYTMEGDIKMVCAQTSSYDELRCKFKSRKQIAERLSHLVAYRSHEVMWPLSILTAALSSLLLLYAISRLSLETYIVAFTIIFVAIDVPKRWSMAHRLAGNNREAAQLYAKIFEYLRN